MNCKSIVIAVIAAMHDKSPSLIGKTALQISFLVMLSKFVMQLLLVRYFCNAYQLFHDEFSRFVVEIQQLLVDLIKCKSVWVWKSVNLSCRFSMTHEV